MPVLQLALAWTSFKAAGLNVKINASGAPDPEKAQIWMTACEEYEVKAESLLVEIKTILKTRVGLQF